MIDEALRSNGVFSIRLVRAPMNLHVFCLCGQQLVTVGYEAVLLCLF